MARVTYAKEAREDLGRIWRHYAENAGVAVADELADKIHATIRRTVASFPRSGRVRPELGRDVRSYPVLPYIVFYVARKRGLRVLRVLHGHRDIRAPLMSLLTA